MENFEDEFIKHKLFISNECYLFKTFVEMYF